MRSIHWYFILALMMFALCSCAQSKVRVIGGGTESIDNLQSTLDSTGAPSPTIGQYQEAREDFLAGLNGILAQREKETGSSLRTAKNIVVTSGVVLGVGGLVAGFLVDSDDDKAMISQSSAGVASVAGIISLLPIGSEPKGAQSIVSYLKVQMPIFEQRWPAEPSEPLTPEQWQEFSSDARQMQVVVAELGK